MSSDRRSSLAMATRTMLLSAFLLVAGFANAATVTIEVVEMVNGAPTSVNGFKYLIQEDTTFPVNTSTSTTDPDKLLSTSFHASHHPLARAGAGAALEGDTDPNASSAIVTDVPVGRYYVSVLPYSGYSMSGGPLEITADGDTKTVQVVVQAHPIPTAQISVFLFHDNNSINGTPDLPEESNPTTGELDANNIPIPDTTDPNWVDWSTFNIVLEEPGGRYGAAGGQVIEDAFGNPLGTTYTDIDPGTGLAVPGARFVKQRGDGTLHPDGNGFLTISNLAPGKYGIIAVPPTGSNWQQVSTIEGTKVIDAWVKANEPNFFVEFGPPGPHVFIGFLKSTANGGFPALTGATTISGRITDMHTSRPPKTEFHSGRAFPDCWIGINEGAGLIKGKGVYAGPCDEANGDSTFEITGLSEGDYTLKVFDGNLDIVIATMGFSVNADGVNCNGTNLDGTPVTPACDFGDVPVFNWFTRLSTGIFQDDDEDGFWDANEVGLGPESQAVTLRWRDGTVYQGFPMDNDGLAPFDEVFPFFHWLIAEVSFGNKKATGATYVIDDGGAIPADNGWDMPSFDELTPQPQCQDDGSGTGRTSGYVPDGAGNLVCPAGTELITNDSGNNLSRTETGPVLTTGFQGFLGQTNVLQFGKTDYKTFDFSNPMAPTFIGENGGISGIVFYATTRAENDPRYAAAEEWEPGVPRVQVNLYADGDIDSFPLGDFPGPNDINWIADPAGDTVLRDLDDDIIDDINGDGVVTLADVDNYPLGWGDGSGPKGPEDLDRNGNGIFDHGDAIQIVWTDSFDDNLPTGCQGETFYLNLDPTTPTDCFDGLRNFNQVRPAVFDGGYAFSEYDIQSIINEVSLRADSAEKTATLNRLNNIQADIDAYMAIGTGTTLQLGLLPGDYIVEGTVPPGYETLLPQHKNVDFGDEYLAETQALPPVCVGDPQIVPDNLTQQTRMDGVTPIVPAADLVGAPFAGESRAVCDRKKVPLSAGQNAAADFFLMTEVPVVANVSGMILNDLANEFNPGAPNFSEKYAPPHMPVGFYDWEGNRVNKVYSDEYGRYDAVVPSTYSANLPQPSGMSPNMLSACMNDSSQVPNPFYDPANPENGPEMILDPNFDPQYSQFCYTLQFMPGTITYLDTPVVPVGAFAGPGQFPVDCERPTETPMVASVSRRGAAGPGPFARTGQTVLIRSMGPTEVLNPEWDGVNLAERYIVRNYGFGTAQGTVVLVNRRGQEFPMTVTQWGNGRIIATVPNVDETDYQLLVRNGIGEESPYGVTLTVGRINNGVEQLSLNANNYGGGPWGRIHRVAPGGSIQDAIDAANAGDLILVPPGEYSEILIMWKPVRLQGYGAGEVVLNARQAPTNKIAAWRQKTAELVGFNTVDRIPGQQLAPFGFAGLAEALFPTEEGAAVFVLGASGGSDRYVRGRNRYARVDGFTITGASQGGGIIANGYNQYLQISNNRIQSNFGSLGGGIRIGHPNVSAPQNGNLVYSDAKNDSIRIHHNYIVKNGSGGNGGGISLFTGSDKYQVDNNVVCGNFAIGNGGGIAHAGKSEQGVIEDNEILFNEVFSQMTTASGGGISIAGLPALQADPVTGLANLSPGSGRRVTIDSNEIRGNMAGSGDGGGIAVLNVNGLDIVRRLDRRNQWNQIDVYNNVMTNNVAALGGGGMAIADAVKVVVRGNTISNNDSTATGAGAFSPGVTNISHAMPAGFVSRTHSDDFRSLMNNFVTNGALPNARRTQWRAFSDAVLRDNIMTHNRSLYWRNDDDPATPAVENGLVPATCDATTGSITTCPISSDPATIAGYSVDLAVLDGFVDLTASGTWYLNPVYSLMTAVLPQYSGTNNSGDPGFVNGYFNQARNDLLFPEFTVLQTALAFDEGGNFIQVSYGPLSILEAGANANPANNTVEHDYHITPASAANDMGSNLPGNENLRYRVDIDNDLRPETNGDVGADQN